MIKIYEKQRAAISSNGWLTLISDLRNWRFDIYVGGEATKEELVDKFRVHLRASIDFVDDVCMNERYHNDDERDHYAQSASKWLERKLVECNICNTSGHRASGVTIPSKSGPIVVAVPGFDLSDPHCIATLAHEFIHAAMIFSDKLGIEEGGGYEFMANIHTTLFERTLRIVSDFKVNAEKVGESPAKLIQDAARSAAGFKRPVQEGMPLAINDWLVNMIAYLDVPSDEYPYKIYLVKSKDVADLYQLVISDKNTTNTRHYVVMCNFKLGEMFPKLDDIIRGHKATDGVRYYENLASEIGDVFGFELIKEACEKYRFCFASEEELDTIKSKYHRSDVYKFQKGTTFTDHSRDAYVSLNGDTMLMISCFNGRYVKLITNADGEYEVSLVEFDRFVREGAATFCVPNRNPNDNDENVPSFFDVDDTFIFTKGVHLHISAETKYSELELADEKTLIITRIEGEWIFLDDTKSDLGFRITSKDMFNYYQHGKILYKRKAKDEPEPAASSSSCNEEKEIEDMLAKAPECTDDEIAVEDNFVIAKDIWGFRTNASDRKDKHLRKGLKITLVSIKECYVIFQGFTNMRTRKFLGNKHEFKKFLHEGFIEKIDGPILQETGEIRTGTIFICKEELKMEDLPGLEYNLGKGVKFEITSMSPDLKRCDISVGSYEASGFNVARIEKLLHDGVIVKKTQSN